MANKNPPGSVDARNLFDSEWSEVRCIEEDFYAFSGLVSKTHNCTWTAGVTWTQRARWRESSVIFHRSFWVAGRNSSLHGNTNLQNANVFVGEAGGQKASHACPLSEVASDFARQQETDQAKGCMHAGRPAGVRPKINWCNCVQLIAIVIYIFICIGIFLEYFGGGQA